MRHNLCRKYDGTLILVVILSTVRSKGSNLLHFFDFVLNRVLKLKNIIINTFISNWNFFFQRYRSIQKSKLHRNLIDWDLKKKEYLYSFQSLLSSSALVSRSSFLFLQFFSLSNWILFLAVNRYTFSSRQLFNDSRFSLSIKSITKLERGDFWKKKKKNPSRIRPINTRLSTPPASERGHREARVTARKPWENSIKGRCRPDTTFEVEPVTRQHRDSRTRIITSCEPAFSRSIYNYRSNYAK